MGSSFNVITHIRTIFLEHKWSWKRITTFLGANHWIAHETVWPGNVMLLESIKRRTTIAYEVYSKSLKMTEEN